MLRRNSLWNVIDFKVNFEDWNGTIVIDSDFSVLQ